MSRRIPPQTLKRLPALLLTAGLIFGSSLALAQALKPANYEFSKGTLNQALQYIGTQSGKTISYAAGLIPNRAAPEIKGVLTVDQALETALAGSGLEAVSGEKGYVIRRIAAGRPTADVAQLDAVTVSGARRREAHAQRPPTAVSRQQGSTLEESHIEDIQDLQFVVPGLFIESTDSNDTQISIRGVGDGGGQSSGDQNIGMPSSVATFVDNVYYPRPGIIRSLSDIDYVDVYKGPNGTVFGMNATGGAVDIHTKEPSFTPEGSASVSYADRNTSKVSASLSGPVNDIVAYRFNAVHAESEGSVKNLYDNNRVNGYERTGARAQILVKPDDSFQLKLTADYSYELATPTRVLQYVAANSSYPASVAAIGGRYVVGGRETVQDDVTTTRTETGGLSADAAWKFGNGYTFRSVSAWRQYHYSPQYADELSVRIFSNSGTKVSDGTIAQTFSIESPRGKYFDYVTGVSYFRQKQDTEAHTRYANTAIVNTYAGSGYRALDILRYGVLHDEMTSFYNRSTFHLGDRLDFQVGARLTYDERMGRFVRRNRSNFDSGEVREYKVLPSATSSLKFKISEDWNTYLSYGYGQKAGGINVSAGAARAAGYDTLLLKPETTRNVELGLQGVLIPDVLSITTDVFRTKVSEFQTQGYDEEAQTSYLMNAGTYRSQGVEAGLDIKPLRNLSISLAAIINDARYTDYKNATCPAEITATFCDMTGQRVFKAPKQVYSLGSRYSWEAGNYQPYVTGRYTYRSWTFGTVDNSVSTRIPGFGLASFSAGAKLKTGDGVWDASLWVTNAFNKLYYTRLNGSSTVVGYVGDPRTVGMTLKYAY